MELNPKAEHKEQALKVLKVCDANRTNEIDLQYDERNPFIVCTYASLIIQLMPLAWALSAACMAEEGSVDEHLGWARSGRKIGSNHYFRRYTSWIFLGILYGRAVSRGSNSCSDWITCKRVVVS